MYAVVRTGGKQYRVTAGDIFEVEKLEGEIGETITIEDVLLVANEESATIGQPLVDGAAVRAKITGQYRGKKILVFRYRPKKRIRVRRGHRQYLTRLEVESVSFGGVTYDTVPEKAASSEDKPKRKRKAKKPKAAAAPAAVESIVEKTAEEAVVETTVEETVVETTTVETSVVEETLQEVAVAPVVETPVKEVKAETVTSDSAEPDKADDLTKVSGIGKVFQGRLREEFDINSFAQLAQADAEKLAELCERSVDEVKDWISQAKELAG